MAELQAGDRFGEFVIEGLVGRGGMGLVYRARQERLGRLVALKVIAPHLAADEGFRERFRKEAQMAAAIDHPNILPIYDAGEVEGHPFLAMRFVDGTDMLNVIAEQAPLDPGRTMAIAEQIAHALDTAHARGLIHRDVKPANILLDRGMNDREVVYLTDFGLTRGQTDTRMTKTGNWVGTVDYMAPEQFQARATGAKVDQYSLACVVFEALTGTRPFPRDSDLQIMYAHVHDERPLASERRAALPSSVDGVLLRGMATDPDDRFGSCGELARELRSALGLSGEGATVPHAAQVAAGTVVGDVVPARPPLSGETVVGSGDTLPPAPAPGRPARGLSVGLSRNKLALAGGGVLAAGVIAALALSSGGGGDSSGTGAGTTGSTATTVTTVTTSQVVPPPDDGFPPKTAVEVLDIAAKPARGTVIYQSNTPSLKGKIRITTDGAKFLLLIRQADGLELRAYARNNTAQWVCAKNRQVSYQCFKVANLSPANRRDLQGTFDTYNAVLSDEGIKRTLRPLVLTLPEVFADRQIERKVACVQKVVDGDRVRLCTTIDGIVTEIAAVSDGTPVLLRATSLDRRISRDEFDPPARLR